MKAEGAMRPVPTYLRNRPVWNGYVVPYFVTWFKGDQIVDERTPGAKPDFRVVDMRRAGICRQRNMCWICGKQLGAYKWFVFGPSSAIARKSAEPPSHRECAHYAVQTCPYMLTPGKAMIPPAKLRPDEYVFTELDDQHPNVCVLWACRTYEPIMADPSRGSFYYVPGDPDIVEFWQAGHKATRKEIEAAVEQVFVNHPHVDRKSRDVAWRVERLMRYAPPEIVHVDTAEQAFDALRERSRKS